MISKTKKMIGVGPVKNKIKVSTSGLTQIVGKSRLDYLRDERPPFNVSIANHTFVFHNAVTIEFPYSFI